MNRSIRSVFWPMLFCVFALSSQALFGQGQVYFNNRVTGVVDARVTTSDGFGLGAGWIAQLFGGPAGTPLSGLTPLFPTTTFRTSSAAAMGYLNGVVVTVPGVAPGEQAALVMRVSCGEPAASISFAESNLITIAIGGGILPPANWQG